MLDLGQNDLIICKKIKIMGRKGCITRHRKTQIPSDDPPAPLCFQFLKRTNEVKYSRMLTHIKIKCTQIL